MICFNLMLNCWIRPSLFVFLLILSISSAHAQYDAAYGRYGSSYGFGRTAEGAREMRIYEERKFRREQLQKLFPQGGVSSLSPYEEVTRDVMLDEQRKKAQEERKRYIQNARKRSREINWYSSSDQGGEGYYSGHSSGNTRRRRSSELHQLLDRLKAQAEKGENYQRVITDKDVQVIVRELRGKRGSLPGLQTLSQSEREELLKLLTKAMAIEFPFSTADKDQ